MKVSVWRFVEVIALALTLPVAVSAADISATGQSTPALKLKFSPTCDQDKDGPFLPEIPRFDLTVTLGVGVLASGAVEKIHLIDYQPPTEQVERLGKRFAHCWRRAVYDTAGIDSAAFPITQKLRVVWKARDAAWRLDE